MTMYADFLAVILPYLGGSDATLARFLSDDMNELLENLQYTYSISPTTVNSIIGLRAQLDTHMRQLLPGFNEIIGTVAEQLKGNSKNTTAAISTAFLPMVTFLNDISTTITTQLINKSAWKAQLNLKQARLLKEKFCNAITANLIKQSEMQLQAGQMNVWLCQEDTLHWLAYEINKHCHHKEKVTFDEILTTLTTDDYSQTPSDKLLIHFYKLSYWRVLNNFNEALANKIEGSVEHNEVWTCFNQFIQSLDQAIRVALDKYTKFLHDQEENLQLIRSSSSRNKPVEKLSEKRTHLRVNEAEPVVEESLVASDSTTDDEYDEVNSGSGQTSKRTSKESPVVGSGSSELSTIFPSDSPLLLPEPSVYTHVSFILNKEIKQLFQLSVDDQILKRSVQVLNPNHKILFNLRLALSTLTLGNMTPRSMQNTPHTPTTPSTPGVSDTTSTPHTSEAALATPSSAHRLATPHTAPATPRNLQEPNQSLARKEFIFRITPNQIAIGFVPKTELLPGTAIVNGSRVTGLSSPSLLSKTFSDPTLIQTATREEGTAMPVPDRILPMSDGQAVPAEPQVAIKRSNSFFSLSRVAAHLVSDQAEVVGEVEPEQTAVKAKKKGKVAKFIDFVTPDFKSFIGFKRHKH